MEDTRREWARVRNSLARAYKKTIVNNAVMQAMITCIAGSSFVISKPREMATATKGRLTSDVPIGKK